MRINKGYEKVWQGNVDSAQIQNVKIDSVSVICGETCIFINKDEHFIVKKGLKGQENHPDYVVIKQFPPFPQHYRDNHNTLAVA